MISSQGVWPLRQFLGSIADPAVSLCGDAVFHPELEIAHDPAAGTFLLTGKRWPAMFEVRFVPVA